MKETFYFSHDYEPTSDPKIQALIKDFEWSGYGLFWRIIEMLHSDELHKLPKKKFIFISLSSNSTTVEQVMNIVEHCITEYELFSTDGDFFWSDRVLRNIDKRNLSFENKSKAGKASAESRKNQQRSTGDEQKPTKERKGKESKRNKNKEKGIFSAPILEEVISYFTENGYSATIATKAFNFYHTGNWKDSNGNQVRNWKQKMQSVWFTDENKNKSDQVKVRIIQTGEVIFMDRTKFNNRTNQNEIVLAS